MDREKGAASATCPSCGNELSVVAQPDGGLVTENCANCSSEQGTSQDAPSAPTLETAGQQPVASRELGVMPSSTDSEGEDGQ